MYEVIAEKSSYTFADYYKLNLYVEDLLAYFGYGFHIENSSLPSVAVDATQIEGLRQRLVNTLPHINLTTEMARREFLIAPVLMELIALTGATIRSEYPLSVNEKLRGTLDYLVRAKNNLLVIEAKQGDLERGFTQLAVELVALDAWLDSTQSLLYGAVSVGNVWQFGILEREVCIVRQYLQLYRVPDDLTELLGTLVAMLNE